MLASALKPDKIYDQDRRVMRQAWVGSVVILLILGYMDRSSTGLTSVELLLSDGTQDC